MKIPRNSLLTPQESKLIGSTPSEKYTRFYVPLAVQDGADIRAVDYERMSQKIFYGYSFCFVNERGERVLTETGLTEIILAPLSFENGETLFDPRAVDRRLILRPDGMRLR